MGRLIDENQLIDRLKKSKKVQLIEPPYRRVYIPLGLAKISSFLKDHGKEVYFDNYPRYQEELDLICVSTCFTNDAKTVLKTINEIERSLFLKDVDILVGGIFASLMPEYIIKNTRRAKVFVNCSDIIDSYLPDYSLDYNIKGFFNNCITLFTTRGCPNKCGYCMVWRMEPKFHILENWDKNIIESDREVCVVSDNNFLVSPSEHVKNVINLLNERKKKVIFNNGVDCKLINKENAKLLASLSYIRHGFRTAFDRMSDDGHYQKAMELMQKVGFRISGNSYTYVLFNFNDTPQEAYYRAQQAWRYKNNPYLMRYRPLNQTYKKLDYVGKYWTKNLIKAFSNWGQTFGYNRGDKTFESWIKSKDSVLNKNGKCFLTDKDWDKWYYKR
jgi:hypothetical protein